MLELHETEYLLDEGELHEAGFSILSASQIDAEAPLDTADPAVYEPTYSTVYRAPLAFIPTSDDPTDDLAGYAPDRFDPALIAAELAADEDELLSFLHRLDDLDVSAWQLNPESDMSDERKAERAEARDAWRADQLRLRKVQLHRLLIEFYGTRDYRSRTVTVWIDDASQAKGVRPEELGVLAWIAGRIAEKGSELAGVASCAALMRRRLAARTKQQAEARRAA